MTARIASELIDLREIVVRFGMTAETIHDWIAAGLWPRPLIQVRKTTKWRRDQIEHYLAKGEWPEGAKFTPGVGRGRQTG